MFSLNFYVMNNKLMKSYAAHLTALLLIQFFAQTTFAHPVTLISGEYDNATSETIRVEVIEGCASVFTINDQRHGKFFIRMPLTQSSIIQISTYPKFIPICKIRIDSIDETHASITQIERNYKESVLCDFTGDPSDNTAKFTLIKNKNYPL